MNLTGTHIKIGPRFRRFLHQTAVILIITLVWLAILQFNVALPLELNLLLGAILLSSFVVTSVRGLWSKKRLFGFTWYPRTIGFSILMGLVSVLSFWYLASAMSVQSPEILIHPLLYHLYRMIFMANILILLTTLFWFLLNSEIDHLDYVFSPYLLGFLVPLVILSFSFDFDWRISLAVLLLGLASFLGALYLHKNPYWIRFSSRFFSLSAVILFTSGLSYLLTPSQFITTFHVLSYTLWLLLFGYLGLAVLRIATKGRFTLFESGERLHLRLTGTMILLGVLVLKISEWLSDIFLPPDIAEFSLFVLFLFTGVLITATFVITQRVTSPLIAFKEGLGQITAGTFDTTIPVTTKDEVGELAHAYNMMVYRLRDLNNELASTERQAAFSEMARQVAHEIKNPLTPMKLKIQHLQRSFLIGKNADELAEDVKKITSELIEQVESLNNIARNFSKYAKPITSEFVAKDLNELVDETMQLYQHEHRIQILIDHSENPLVCSVPSEEWKRVLINLVNNSIEALTNGGIIIIRTYAHKDRAFLEVVDNGEGIAVEDKPKIFTPNFSTKSSGTGLGLAITKKLVEAMDGDIQFASAKGAGTTFTLSFPLKLSPEPDTTTK